MIFSLNIKNDASILEGNEIYAKLADAKLLNEFIVRSAITSLVISIEKDSSNFPTQKFKILQDQFDFALELEDKNLWKMCKNAGLPFYFAEPIESYYDLRAALDLGVSQVVLGGVLYFDLKQVRQIVGPDIKIRLTADLCCKNDHMPHKESIRGTYIRPEDVDAYAQYVDVLQFYGENEEKLYEVYSKKSWLGDLNKLITNLGVDLNTRSFTADFAKARIQCRQDCMRRGTCRLCYTMAENSIGFLRRYVDWIIGEGFSKN